ncbi:hypothetical protein J7E81_01450 [Bacillus sp. ISL-18]|uniref:hypothetical protein n=1 Tax=Bacillus sp. ISL-18 TaxID=2819118 RepID=UPI001BE699EC|nr:hypothetical protein [Bacillus sp. ISL-18]MBT2653911.1 hypothetical protein [Bacillus sp. ISL-18]
MKSSEAKILTVDSAVTWAQARNELNKTMLKLRTAYGYAPPKDISNNEMDQRCKDISKAVYDALETYVETTGMLPDRMRNLSLYKTSKDFPQKKYDGLQAYTNVPDDRLKKAPLYTVEAAGNLLNFNADYLVRVAHLEAVSNKTRKEWARLEYEYVERNDYNLRDLYNDLMERLDAAENYITYEEYRVERKKWRRCKYYACDNYFPIANNRIIHPNIKARRPNAEYCCDECKKGQENAQARFEKTGTYLPDHAYEYILEETRERKEKHHMAIIPENIIKIIDKPR